MKDCEDGQVVAVYRITSTTEVIVRQCPIPVPVKPLGGNFTFIQKDGSTMTGTFGGVNPPNPSDNVTARSGLISVNGVNLPPFDLLATPMVSFPCNVNDACVAVVTDTNAFGSVDGDPITSIATLPVVGTPPAKPTGGMFSFSA
jgi:hypothetical protein